MFYIARLIKCQIKLQKLIQDMCAKNTSGALKTTATQSKKTTKDAKRGSVTIKFARCYHNAKKISLKTLSKHVNGAESREIL